MRKRRSTIGRPDRERCTSGLGRPSPGASPPPTSFATPGRSTSRAAGAPMSGTWTETTCVDFHNGFGSMVQGHAHPAIERAVRERLPLGNALRSADRGRRSSSRRSSPVASASPKWRYTNSGSEATMDAIRIARGATGRDTIVKIFGSYHGHHDYVMVSIGVAVRARSATARTTRRCPTAPGFRRPSQT